MRTKGHRDGDYQSCEDKTNLESDNPNVSPVALGFLLLGLSSPRRHGVNGEGHGGGNRKILGGLGGQHRPRTSSQR